MATDISQRAHAPVASDRRGTIAFAVAAILHCLFGVLWALLVSFAISFRDCFFECDPVTDAERYTDAAVWCVGGLSWAALLAFILLSRGTERAYLALALVPIWFVLALVCGVTAIGGSSG